MSRLAQWYYGRHLPWRYRLWHSLPISMRAGIVTRSRNPIAALVRRVTWVVADVVLWLRDAGPMSAAGRDLYFCTVREQAAAARVAQ